MRVDEYAKYVINNMNRATLGNALNITNKFNVEYDFKDFLESIDSYILELLQLKIFDSTKGYSILHLSNKAFKMYESDFNYNKAFIIDDFIIELWQVFNGD